MAESSFSGVRLAARDGAVILSWVDGFADVGTDLRWTADTPSQVASISKQFAAVVALLLVEQGVLSLDDRVTDLLSDAPAYWGDVSVQHLLTHTSGMSHWGSRFGFDPATHLDPPERCSELLATRPPDPPGRVWRYSSPGYVLLTAVLENAAGRRYPDLVQGLIIDRLTLRNTTVVMPRGSAVARGYRRGRKVAAWDLHTMPGAGDIWSSANDLARFTAALHAGALLGAPAQVLLHDITVPHDDNPNPTAAVTTTGYGLGHFTGSIHAENAYLHLGDNPGYQSLAAWIPATGTTIVALSNDGADDLDLAVAEFLRDPRIETKASTL